MLPIRIKACSESDLRMLGNLARNIQRVLPVTQADIDAAAALGKGWVVWKVIEVNDPIDNLRGGTQLVIKQNSITPGQNVRRVLIVSGPGGETVVIGPGPSPLLLPDAIANSLQYVKAFGGTEQNGTPTPDTPVDIVSNNGVLKASPNILQGEWFLNQSRTSAGGALYSLNGAVASDIFPVQSNTTYTVCYDGVANDARWYEYDANKSYITGSFVAASKTITTSSNTKYISVSFMSGQLPDAVTQEKYKLCSVNKGNVALPFIPYGTIYTDGTVETINAHGTNLLDLANCIDGYYYTPAGEYTATPNARLSNYIPVKAGDTYTVGLTGTEGQSNVRINLFDTAKNWLSQTVFVSYTNEKRTQSITAAQDGFLAFSANFQSSSRIDWNTAQVVQGSYTAETMSEYAPYYNGGTATAEMLLKVGDYKDVQEILSGAVTRNVGVRVLDGTEDWSRTNARAKLVLTNSAISTTDGWAPYCTHYQGFVGSVSVANMPDNSCKVNVTTQDFLIKDATHNTDLATWKQYLADQYAAGTPVIVIYPLATPTTESVTGQTLQVTNGDNVLEITQASLTGLELEAGYQKVA